MQKTIFIFIFQFIVIFTFAQKKGKFHGQKDKESEAIKRLLERESATWRNGNIKAHAACWFIQPYSRIVVSTGDSLVHEISPLLMLHPPATMVGQGGTSINTNYKMSINGNNAWVSHDEESTAKDGKKTYSYEFRMLEKINKRWRIVGQSIHMYKPKK